MQSKKQKKYLKDGWYLSKTLGVSVHTYRYLFHIEKDRFIDVIDRDGKVNLSFTIQYKRIDENEINYLHFVETLKNIIFIKRSVKPTNRFCVGGM